MLERGNRNRVKNIKKKRSRLKGLLITLLVLIIVGAGAYTFRKPLALMAFDLFLSGQVEEKLEKSYSPIDGEKPKPVAAKQTEPFTALLLGVDQRDNEPARSDTLIYAVVRPADSKVLLVSIPRDTYTEIVGRDRNDKINHAYAFGGAKMSKDTVANFLGYPADYYAAINFEGLREVVDELGGIELPIDKDIVNKHKDHEKFTIKAGKPLYDGQEALNFVRYREDSDFNRTKRHQIFLSALVDRMLKLDQIGKIPDLMNMLGENFKTDMTPSFIIDLSKQLLTNQAPQISGFTIMGEGMRKNGVYYIQANEEDVTFAEQLIENWSDPNTKTEDLLNPNTQSAQEGQNSEQPSL
ncbi:LCP family protein [Paenibacillus woosongensis]|uniref:LytR family transcriptional regulator n=1 Tax=Paenibacillus woosongensis TaxID=307580 RepID=A0A7X2Z6S9_9BACL|nr:LCP family protein [Paenibacillus woosongensis]MUG47906.1 LytR family transcriptional regulator [Paenibacillus woosongensis]